MTTASKIVQSAYREGNLIPAGKVPTDDEVTEALDRLYNIVLAVFGTEMGENLVDWLVPAPQRTAPVAANFPQGPLIAGFDEAGSSALLGNNSNAIWPYPPKNSRLVFGSVATTVYFPEAPDDGSRMAIVQGSGAGDGGVTGAALTLDGNGRTIEGANTQTYDAPVAGRAWFYRADLADWVAVTTLTADSEMPFPPEFDDLWITALAIRLSPRYTKPVSAETAGIYKQMLSKFSNRYMQSQVTVYGSQQIPNSDQAYLTGNWQR